MEQIKNLIGQAIETLAPQTSEARVTTEPLKIPAKSKFAWEFETLGDKELVKMLGAARLFCREMTDGKRPRWLSLVGPSGTGKTHLAKKISRFFRENLDGQLRPGQNPKVSQWCMHGGFVSWRKLTDDLRDRSYGRFRDICDDYFLALDDIGAEYKTAFVTSKLDQLFDARQGKWTVITGNLSLAEIKETLDARIASRMIRGGSVVIDVNAPDFNLRGKVTA